MTATDKTAPASTADRRAGDPADGWVRWLRTGAGEAGKLIAGTPWASTALGPIETWPPALRNSLSLCLATRVPMMVLWGAELTFLCNDACLSAAADLPAPVLGAPASRLPGWEQLRPRLQPILQGEPAVLGTREPWVVERPGGLLERFFTTSFSAIVDEADGALQGILGILLEETSQVVSDRRLTSLVDLAAAVAELRTVSDLARRTCGALQRNRADHPAVLVFEVLQGADRDQVVAVTHVVADAAVERLARQLARECVTRGTVLDLDVAADASAEVAALRAFPIGGNAAQPALVLVIGRSRRVTWDADFRNYLDIAVDEVAQALARLAALDRERARVEGLVELDAAKSAFLATVSHELRTPLTLIAAPLADALAEPDLAADTRSRLGLASASTTRLTRLVDALLDFSRLEAGRIAPDLAATDVPAVTRPLVDSFAPLIRQAGLDFIPVIPDLPRTAVLDRDMYERIVLNLLSNAVKYTPTGSIRIELRHLGEQFSVAVSDTGIGISSADQKRIFRWFEQLPRRSEARSPEGAGIGLTMVSHLARLLGGSVSVASILGSGSTFTLVLPYVAPTPASGAGRSVTRREPASFLAEAASWLGEESSGARATGAPDGRLRLMIVEDSPDMCRYLVEVFSDTFQVETAADGRDALTRLRRSRPHGVLADVMMPGLDGFELVRAIRADPDLALLPIVLLSAKAGSDSKVQGLDLGADDYIGKPFSRAELRSRVGATLLRAQSRLADAAWRRAMMASLQEPIAIADADGRVTELNEAFVRLFGWSLSEGPYRPPYPWWPDPASEPTEYALIAGAQGAIAPTAPRTGLFPFRARGGRRVWASWWGAQVATREQGRTAVIMTFHDLTRERDSQARRAAAVRIAGEFGDAEELADLLATAASGFGVLFDGAATLALVGALPDTVMTPEGPVNAATLPDGLLARLRHGEPEPPDTRPTPGILISARPAPRIGCRTWVQFGGPRPVLTDERIVADLLAEALDLAVDRLLASASFAQRQEHLQRAVDSHRLVGQAVGILVERHRITPGQAFDRLRSVSQRRNLKLREIAELIVETGIDPEDVGR